MTKANVETGEHFFPLAVWAARVPVVGHWHLIFVDEGAQLIQEEIPNPIRIAHHIGSFAVSEITADGVLA